MPNLIICLIYALLLSCVSPQSVRKVEKDANVSYRIPCDRVDLSVLRKIAHTPGTRTIMYIMAHDKTSIDIADEFRHCDTDWMHIMSLPTNMYFESVMYKTFFPQHQHIWSQYDYILTATYKTLHRNLLPRYMPVQSIKDMASLIFVANQSKYDIVPFLRDTEEMMTTSVKYHTIWFLRAWNALLLAMGFEQEIIIKYANIHAFYRNIYIITPKKLQQLMHFMQQAMNIAETNEKVKQLFNKDAHYVLGTVQTAKRVFGTPYYQLHPFIFERLPAFYFYATEAKICLHDSGPCKMNYKG
jgi:hypothetical protein